MSMPQRLSLVPSPTSKMKGSRQPTKGMLAGGMPISGCFDLCQVTKFLSPDAACEVYKVETVTNPSKLLAALK